MKPTLTYLRRRFLRDMENDLTGTMDKLLPSIANFPTRLNIKCFIIAYLKTYYEKGCTGGMDWPPELA